MTYTKYELLCQPLKGLFSRPGIFKKMSKSSTMDLIHHSMDSVLHARSHSKLIRRFSTVGVIHHCLKGYASLLYKFSTLPLVFFML
jgi:hypothetical protein